MELIFFPSCPCENDARKKRIIHQHFRIIWQNFRPMCQKFCSFWPLNFHMHQKAPKKSNRVADLDREPARKFYLNQFFWYFDDGVFKWKPHYLKVQMGKRRSHGWIKHGRKIMAKIVCKRNFNIGAREKTLKKNVHYFYIWMLSFFSSMHKRNESFWYIW